MSKFFTLVGLFCVIGLQAEKPNIIIILADDMGFSDIGAYGGEIETPALDSLAKGGIKFSNFYNSGRCCPTRASLLTGLHPHQTGIGWMTNPPHTFKYDHGPEYPGYRGHMHRRCVTMAEVLKEAGYATFLSGKWHLGMNKQERWPLQRGFEKFYGTLAGVTNYFYPEAPRGITVDNEQISDPESTTERRFYTTDAFTDHAIRFIKAEKAAGDRPFFLYLSFTAPHWPLHAHEEEVKKYRGKYLGGWDQLRVKRLERQRKLGLFNESLDLSERSYVAWNEIEEEKQKEMDLRMAYYAAMIDRMDQNIGKLVAQLKEIGEFENSLIMFLSDNGACQEGGRLGGRTDPFDTNAWESDSGAGPSYGEVWANASSTPFRKFKHFTHEGGIATPFIAHWPEGIAPSEDWYRFSAYLIDIAPTVYEIAEADYPRQYAGHAIPTLPGISLVPSFKGKALKRRDPLFFEHEDNAAIIDGKWKLVGSGVSIPDGPDENQWELYNIEVDRSETHDLSHQFPDKVKQLANRWQFWAHSVGVYPKPVYRSKQ